MTRERNSTGKINEPQKESPTDASPVLDFTNPNGVPDWRLPEREAELWLLSQQQRRAGVRVGYDADVNRWRVVGITEQVRKLATCVCGRSFEVARSTAKFCSTTCRIKAHRRSM